MLKTHSFTITKDGSLSQVDSFLKDELGYDAYLIDELKASKLNDRTNLLTIVYQDISTNIVEDISPRPGSIFTSDIFGADFDYRVLFSSPIDPGTIEDGTFILDGADLSSSLVKVVPGTNNYLYQIDVSTASTEAAHEVQIDGSKIRRIDGSLLEYSPAGGYILHSQAAAHLGESPEPLSTRRRGLLKCDRVRTSKGAQVQQVLTESLSKKQLNIDSLVSYTIVSENNIIDIYYIYISDPEPQILSGYPYKNSFYPSTSVPSNVILVFNTKVDSTYLANNISFQLIEDYSTITNIATTDVTVMDDERTVKIAISSYIGSQNNYSLLLLPGLKSKKGFSKLKPEIWNISVNVYEGGSGGGGGSDGSGASPTEPFLVWDTATALTNEKTISGQSGITVDKTSDPVLVTYDDYGNVIKADGTVSLTDQWDAGNQAAINLGTVMVQSSEPSSPASGQLWLDQSVTPEDGIASDVNITLETGAYQILDTDVIILCSGTFTVTLPSSESINNGKTYWIKNISSGSVTVSGYTSGELIDNSDTSILSEYDSVTTTHYNSDWWII